MSSLALSAPSGQAVFSAEELHAEATRLTLPPSRPNLRRVRRAIEITRSAGVGFNRHADTGRIWSVQSQSSDEVYEVIISSVDLVIPASDFLCSCPDSAFKQNTCKHAIAVAMLEEIERDRVEAQRDHRHLIDRSLSHLLPDSYERLLMAQR